MKRLLWWTARAGWLLSYGVLLAHARAMGLGWAHGGFGHYGAGGDLWAIWLASLDALSGASDGLEFGNSTE